MGSTPHLMLFQAGTVIPTGSRMHGRCRLGCSSSEDGGLYPFRARLRVGSLGSNSRLGGLIIAVAEDAAWDVVNENGPRASTEQIRLLVVDDHAAVRRGLRELLEDRPDFRVIDSVPSAEEAMSGPRFSCSATATR